MTAFHISASDLAIIDDETPRVRDVDLGKALGFDRPRNIRDIIARNASELHTYAPLPRRAAMVEIGSGAKREVAEYWLTEEQALVVVMFSRTDRSAEARREIINVFTEYRRMAVERPVKVKAHRRAAPARRVEPATAVRPRGMDARDLDASFLTRNQYRDLCFELLAKLAAVQEALGGDLPTIPGIDMVGAARRYVAGKQAARSLTSVH